MINIKKNHIVIPFQEMEMDGRDLVQTYYHDQEYRYCVLMEGAKGAMVCTAYDDGMKWFDVTIDDDKFIQKVDNLDKIMRGLPLKAIFQAHQILFLHSSQVGLGNGAIVFTAPSGTGKTTQMNLWVEQEQARAITADRTLLCKRDGVWQTYSFPLDGSAPIRLNCVLDLKVVVALEQSGSDHVERMTPARAVAFLMEQMIIDKWNPRARFMAMEQLLGFVQEIPVLFLRSTKEPSAVTCLKTFLENEELI